MRGLVIADPWIDLILDGTKRWEIRPRNARLRETIALIRKGSGRIFGTARLVDVQGPMSSDQLHRHTDKHCVPPDRLIEYLGRSGTAYAWVMADARRLPEPISYAHPSGAVTWVTLPDNCIGATL